MGIMLLTWREPKGDRELRGHTHAVGEFLLPLKKGGWEGF
jgi:hypothetical protein